MKIMRETNQEMCLSLDTINNPDECDVDSSATVL